MLARLFLDVNFQIFNTDAVTFGAQNLLFGRLGAQFDTLGDHGAIQGQLGGHQRTPWGPDLDDGKHSQSDCSCSGKALAF